MTSQRALGARRLTVTVLWTVGLAASLYGLDRALFTAPNAGWQVATTLDDIPPDAGAVSMPRYVPEALTWPPREMHFRTGERPGFWFGLFDGQSPAARLWIGTGEPLPDALTPLWGCVSLASASGCPPGWHTQSFQAGARVIYLMTDLDPVELRRVMHGLAAHPSGPGPR